MKLNMIAISKKIKSLTERMNNNPTNKRIKKVIQNSHLKIFQFRNY